MSITIQTPPSVVNNHTGFLNWYPALGNRFSFKIKVSRGAIIAFSSINEHTQPMYELVCSGWGNTRTGIWKNPKGKYELNPEVERNTAGLLSDQQFRGFWIHWKDGLIRFGHEGQRLPFLVYQIIEPFEINFVGNRSNAPATWIIDKPRNIWVDATGGSVPEGALERGEDRGMHVYVGRANYEGELVPGCCLYPW